MQKKKSLWVVIFRGQIFKPDDTDLHMLLLSKFYSTFIDDQFGTKPTVARLAASFFPPGLYFDTKRFVQSCSICQQRKYM